MSRRRFVGAASGVAGAWGVSSAWLGRAAQGRGESKTPVVDTHMHVWAGEAKRYPFVHPYDPDYKGPGHEATVEMLLADMDANGVTHSILVQVIYHGWDNRYVADCVRRAPDRFKAHGLIDPTDPKVADRLAYWMNEHPIAGMRLSPIYYRNGRHGSDGWLTSPAHHALWKGATKLGAVFNMFIATSQLPRLETMIRRYPGVPVIVDHLSQIDLGADDPAREMGKLLALARYPNVWVKVSELSSVSRSGTYPFPGAYPWIKQVYEAFGGDKLLWGTGYPGSARAAYKRPTLVQELALIREKIPFFSEEDRAKILGGNAARLWKLSQA